jgi:hypothetical protein
MSGKPVAARVAPPPDIVATATPDEYRAATNILHFGSCAMLVQAWRINPSDPAQLVLVGAIYTYASAERPTVTLDPPRIILGRDPATPARLRAKLLTKPSGPPETWTSDALAPQKMVLSVPACQPWIPAALSVELVNRRQYSLPG